MEIIILSGIRKGQVSSPRRQRRGHYTEFAQTFLCNQFKSLVQDKPQLPWWATRHKEIKEEKLQVFPRFSSSRGFTRQRISISKSLQKNT